MVVTVVVVIPGQVYNTVAPASGLVLAAVKDGIVAVPVEPDALGVPVMVQVPVADDADAVTVRPEVPVGDWLPNWSSISIVPPPVVVPGLAVGAKGTTLTASLLAAPTFIG